MWSRDFSFFDFPDQRVGIELVVFGAPFDGTSSGVPGSREAPGVIRSVSNLLEDCSPILRKNIWDFKIADWGDLEAIPGNPEKTLDSIEKGVREIAESGAKPLMFGGEHLCTLPVIRVLKERYRELYVLQLDAHTDLRENYQGEIYSHATVMRRALEVLGREKQLITYGIRSGLEEEFQLLKSCYSCGTPRSSREERLELLKQYLSEIAPAPLYVTIDLDVFDPAIFPATGTPEAGGIFFDEFIQILLLLEGYPKLVGADIVEYCPVLDSTGASKYLAAKVAREVALLLVQ